MYSLSAEAQESNPALEAVPPAREIELKLRVPAGVAGAVRAAVATRGAHAVRLQARYFDTPDRRLAAAGIALRLRKEGDRWVQALKSRGDGLMQRGEHEVALGRTRAAPRPDLALHAGTAGAAALARALGGHAQELREIFATDIRRTRRSVRAAGGALVELAFDEGEIRAGGARLPVCELELELLRGPPAALAALAGRWVRRHGLWLDPRSKAERGDRLARGSEAVAALHAERPFLPPTMDGAAALRAMLASALGQVLANACEIADGAGSPEHLHQCRVGLRRLRSALRDFAVLAGGDAPAAAAQWQQQLRGLLAQLGSTRDRDALAASLLPQLAAAGAPFAALPQAAGSVTDPAVLLRGAAANALWLEILGYVHAAPAPPDSAAAPSLRHRVRAILARLHRQVAADAARFEALDEAAQHRTRKRVKRLRYGTEFCASLFERDEVAAYLEALRPAQDALGAAQDLAVARALFEPQLEHDPRAWFVLGWLAARRPQQVAACAQALAAVARARRFW